jgi:hypothetical protein
MRLEAITVKRTLVFFTRNLPNMFGVPPLRCSDGLLRFAEVVRSTSARFETLPSASGRVRSCAWRLPVPADGLSHISLTSNRTGRKGRTASLTLGAIDLTQRRLAA